MSEIKHTPGPWYWGEDMFHGGYTGLFRDCGDDLDTDVAYPQCENDGDTGAAWFDEITDADRHLIAAAPDLLEACIEAGLILRRLFVPCPTDLLAALSSSERSIRKALSAAKGES